MENTAEILPMETGIAVYKPYRNQLAEMKKNNASLLFDYESPAGNKDARSHVFKLRKTKAAVEGARKDEKAASLEYGRKVDAEAKEITAEIEAMIDVHQSVLDEIEQREKKRIDDINARIALLVMYQQCAGHDSSETTVALENLKAIVVDESYGELQLEAHKAKALAIQAQEGQHAVALKSEAETAELERLRKEAALRAQQDYEASIRKDAADKAKAEAEEKARRDNEAATARAKAEADAITARAKADAEAAERARKEAEGRAEKAEADRIAAEVKAKQDAIDAAEKAEREKREAIKQEQDRIAAEARAEEGAKAKREADQVHRETIQKAIVDAFLRELPDDMHSDVPMDLPIAIMNIIDAGLIPHVTINY